MLNSDRASPYLLPAAHRTAQLQLQHPSSRYYPTQHLVQVPRKPHFAFESPSLDFTAQIMTSSHPYHLGFNDNLSCTTHSRAPSSCQSLPAEVAYQPYPLMGEKGNRCPGTPYQNQMNPWPLPTGPGRPPVMITDRPWPGTTPTPEVFLPSGDTQPYNSFLLESTDNNSNFSPESEAFNSAAPTTVATPIITADAPRPHDRPQDLAVYLSGSESDSGQEPDDERNIVRDARQDQWTSISGASPRAKSPATASSRRSASFLATEETKLGSSLLPKDIECSARTTRRARSSSRKPKMHQCQTCKKWFPRPSGLATHMNVHSGAKPFTCPVQSCSKKFAVRSNAKRHLRTHGIMPTPDMSFISIPAKDNDAASVPDTNRWIPQTLKERNLKLEDVDTCPSLISELPLVRPSTYMWAGEMVYDERNSFAEASIAPYHPAYWRCLPGPAPRTAAVCISPT